MTRLLRRTGAALGVACVLAACSTSGEIGPDGVAITEEPSAPATSEEPAGTGEDAGEPSEGTAPGDESTEGGATDGDAGGEATDAGTTRTPVSDGGAVGTNGPAYLRGDRSRVVFEVDVQDGAFFPGSVVDHVTGILGRESASTVGLQQGAAVAEQRDVWTPDDLRAAAASTRDVSHGDDTAVLHLLVLRGRYQDEGVLGVAFDSSTAAVFPDEWSDLTTVLLSGDRVARAVTTHEVGHLLGLVGLVQEPTSAHEDPEHPGHSSDRDDVMYWAIETDLIGTLDGVPTDFGPASRADLAALREG